MEELEQLVRSYNATTDGELLGRLRQGDHLACPCSSCRTLAYYHHLKRGGKFKSYMLRNLDRQHQAMLLKYVCLRTV